MPRKRRQPDLADVIVYVHGRTKKLKGPRCLIYQFILDQCLGESAANSPEKVCDECSERLRGRPTKRAQKFEREFRDSA